MTLPDLQNKIMCIVHLTINLFASLHVRDVSMAVILTVLTLDCIVLYVDLTVNDQSCHDPLLLLHIIGSAVT